MYIYLKNHISTFFRQKSVFHVLSTGNTIPFFTTLVTRSSSITLLSTFMTSTKRPFSGWNIFLPGELQHSLNLDGAARHHRSGDGLRRLRGRGLPRRHSIHQPRPDGGSPFTRDELFSGNAFYYPAAGRPARAATAGQ